MIRGHVKQLLESGALDEFKFRYFPKPNIKPEEFAMWEKQVGKGRKNFKGSAHQVVCSNYFVNGKPTYDHPYPTEFLTQSDIDFKKFPSKRSRPIGDRKDFTLKGKENPTASLMPTPPNKKSAPASRESTPSSAAKSGSSQSSTPLSSSSDHPIKNTSIRLSFAFEQITREADLRFYTGFESTVMFKTVFQHLTPIASRMRYWKGEAETKRETPKNEDRPFGKHLFEESFLRKRTGPSRKLTLEQEFLLTMMRLRVGLLVEDLAFRFEVSSGLVASIFFTWVRLMTREFEPLIVWADRDVIRMNLPDSFGKYFSKCRVVIDCTEVMIETPSSLELAATCWSNYKHHYTVKFLVGITPNGAISYLSKCYGGRATDIFITEDSGFVKKLLPGDQVMADRGFKIRELLAYYQCSLAIPPSASSSLQMSKSVVSKLHE